MNSNNYFGIKIRNPEKPNEIVRSPVLDHARGSIVVNSYRGASGPSATSAGVFADTLNFDGHTKSDNALIEKYREIALNPEIEESVNDIVNEAIVIEEEQDPVELNLDRSNLPSSAKKKIVEEFKSLLNLLDFKNEGHNLFRKWYVDGRLCLHKMVDENDLSRGIIELRYIDPRKLKKVREIRRGIHYQNDQNPEFSMMNASTIEYWVYNDNGINSGSSSYMLGTSVNPTIGAIISKDSIAYTDSGLYDNTGQLVISYLHKAIRPLNMMRMLEDAVLVYNITRAPEKRAFYVDVGNLPRGPAEQYLNEIMNKFKTRLFYNSQTGEVRDDRRHIAMTEDFWLPRRDGSRGTEISTIQGGSALNQMLESVDYFRRKLMKALNIPTSRAEGGTVSFSKTATEVSREELKFAKFITTLRSRFNFLFDDLLRTQLIMKGLISPEEWEELKPYIGYRYAKDNFFAKVKENEILSMQLDILDRMHQYVGTWYSKKFVHSVVLENSEEDVKEIDDERKKLEKQGKEFDVDVGKVPMVDERTLPKPDFSQEVSVNKNSVEKKTEVKTEEVLPYPPELFKVLIESLKQSSQ